MRNSIITLSSGTSGATIYFTLNGKLPTTTQITNYSIFLVSISTDMTDANATLIAITRLLI